MRIIELKGKLSTYVPPNQEFYPSTPNLHTVISEVICQPTNEITFYLETYRVYTNNGITIAMMLRTRMTAYANYGVEASSRRELLYPANRLPSTPLKCFDRPTDNPRLLPDSEGEPRILLPSPTFA
jgi:hypothetical protein